MHEVRARKAGEKAARLAADEQTLAVMLEDDERDTPFEAVFPEEASEPFGADALGLDPLPRRTKHAAEARGEHRRP